MTVKAANATYNYARSGSYEAIGTKGRTYRLGELANIHDGRFRVDKLLRNQTSEVIQMNATNAKPTAGKEWILVKVTFLCDLPSDNRCDIANMSFELIGDSGDVSQSEIQAILKNQFTGEVSGGGQKVGQIGFIANSPDKHLLLVVSNLGGQAFFETEERYPP